MLPVALALGVAALLEGAVPDAEPVELGVPDAAAPEPEPDPPPVPVLVLGAAADGETEALGAGEVAELPVGAVAVAGGVATCAEGVAGETGALWLPPDPVGAGAEVGAGELFDPLADPLDSVEDGACLCDVDGDGEAAEPDPFCVEGEEAAGAVA